MIIPGYYALLVWQAIIMVVLFKLHIYLWDLNVSQKLDVMIALYENILQKWIPFTCLFYTHI